MINGKDELYFLLNRIDDIKARTVSGRPLIIDPTNDLNQNYRDIELKQWFTKLEVDEKVLKILKAPSRTKEIDIVEDLDPYEHADDGCWHIELLPAFNKYFLAIQEEPEYQEFTGKKPPVRAKLRLSRKSLEKIWTVLQEIEDKRGITSVQDEISIPQVHFNKAHNEREAIAYSDERLNILKKLENEEKAIKEVRWPNDFHQYVFLKITDKYPEVFSYYEKEYKNIAKDYQKNQEDKKVNEDAIVYEVKYSEKNREILINGFLLAKPDFNRENEIVFTFVYKHANERLTKRKIEIDNDIRLLKELPKIVENLGFTGDLKKVFFDVSSEGILFRNPITRKDLDELKIIVLKLK